MTPEQLQQIESWLRSEAVGCATMGQTQAYNVLMRLAEKARLGRLERDR